MASFSPEDRDVVERVIDEYSSDLPSVSNAVKNFISVMAASSTTEGSMEASTSVGYVNECLRVGKVILKSISIEVEVMPPIEEWIESHPQAEGQTGIERIDEVLRYKVAREMVTAAALKKTSVSKVFGRKLLDDLNIWKGAETRARTLLGADDEVGNTLLNAFSATLTGTGDCESESGSESKRDVTALTWSKDMQGELAARQRARTEEAEARRRRQGETESYIDELRCALTDAPHQEVDTHESKGKGGE
jgi:hypothetical protein